MMVAMPYTLQAPRLLFTQLIPNGSSGGQGIWRGRDIWQGTKSKAGQFSLRQNIPVGPGLKNGKTMASGPKTSWQIEGEKVEAVTDFIFLGSKITADGDCNHEIQMCLLFGRKL